MTGELAKRFSRGVQRQILECLQEYYPGSAKVSKHISVSEEALIPNLAYLEEHFLCVAGLQESRAGIGVGYSKITARGIDFLADDGGLSAILGAVTVKLHADTVRDLITKQIDTTNLPDSEKNSLKKRLADLSGKGLEAATAELVQAGIHQLPNVAEWLQRLLGL